MNEFNKIEAFDKLTQLLQQPPNSTTSQCIQLIFDGQNYLQKIHENTINYTVCIVFIVLQNTPCYKLSNRYKKA